MKHLGKKRSRPGNDVEGTEASTDAAAAGGMVGRVGHFGRQGRNGEGAEETFEDWVDLPSYRPSFGALLVRSGIASDTDVKNALEEGLRTGERLGEVVIRKGWAPEGKIAQLLAEQWQLPYREVDEVAVDPKALQRVPLAVARELKALPVGFEGSSVLLAISEPSEELFAAVKSQVGEASYVVVARSVLDPLIEDSGLSPETAPASAEPYAAEIYEPPELPEPHAPSEVHEASQPQELAQHHEESEPYEAYEPSQPEPYEAPVPVVVYEPEDTYEEPQASARPAQLEELPPGPEVTSATVTAAGNVAGVIEAIDSAASDLGRVRGEVEGLGASLSLAERQLLAYEADLAAAAERHEQDSETIRRLEAELAQRADLFSTLKSQIATVTQTLDEGSGTEG